MLELRMNAVVVSEPGGPDMLQIQEVNRPKPESHQVLVRVELAGVNYLDVMQRSGGTGREVPFIAGVEGMGIVTARGDGVADIAVGQRVGWMAGSQGSFAEYTTVDESKAVVIPDSLSDATAVSSLMQGITAQYLVNETYPVIKSDVAVVHAAAGGVGRLLLQMAKLRGATVIGTTSTKEKSRFIRELGADYVFGYDDFDTRTKEVTDGLGASVVFDGVGETTFSRSLAALRIRGTLVVTGAASGPVPPLDVNGLNTGGSLYLTRPTVAHHIRTKSEIQRRAGEVFKLLETGKLHLGDATEYPIAQVQDAFTALEDRQTTGKLILRVAGGFTQ
ncbi:quinone oxidoreductase family protein [Leucobacter sp. USHLN153]|uniref:quinone oxidoreductase family protein n=1 Tax=Leucobacter sp. USHLN153 TaxID=3081268 RepID=UPI003017EC49